MELKRILLSKNIIICAVVLIIACCGFYIKAQGDNTYYDSSEYYNFKRETIELYKNCSIEQVIKDIDSRIEVFNIFFQLNTYVDIKASDLQQYMEFFAAEEQTYREEHPNEAAIYDEDSEAYSYENCSLEYTALLEVKAQLDYVDTYDEFLENIKIQAENMSSVSIFSDENSFSFRNITKTLEDYEGLEGIEVELGVDEPITTVLDYELVHYFMLIFIILLVTQLLSERKQGLWSIVHASSKGRMGLAVKRLGIIAVSISAIGVLLYGSLFAVSFSYYGGLSDVFRNVQSIAMFQNFTIAMPVWVFILVYIGVNIVSAILVTYFVWLIMSVIANSILAFATLGVIGAIEYAMYTFIPIQSNFSVFKCVNLFSFINPTETLIAYRNLNIFSMAVNRRMLCTVVLIVFFIMFALLCTIVNSRKKPVQSPGRIELIVIKISDNIVTLYRQLIEKLSPLGYELYKVLILQKGILILIVLAWYLISTINTNTIYYSRTGTYMNEFYENYSGVPGQEVNQYLDELNRELTEVYEEYNEAVKKYENGEITYDELFGASMKLDAYSAKQEVYLNISDSISYLQRLKEDRGISGWLLNDAGYRCLFDKDSRSVNHMHALISVFATVLILSGILSYEKKSETIKLVRSVSDGRQVIFKRKLLTSFIITGIIWAIVYGVEVYNIWQLYGFDCFGAPVQSLEFMYSFPLEISVGMYMLMIYFLRLIELVALSGILFAISSVCGYEVSMMASAAVLAVPGVLYIVGINVFKYVSVLEPLGLINIILTSGSELWWLLPVLLVIVLGAVGYGFSAYRWCVTGRRKNA